MHTTAEDFAATFNGSQTVTKFSASHGCWQSLCQQLNSLISWPKIEKKETVPLPEDAHGFAFDRRNKTQVSFQKYLRRFTIFMPGTRSPPVSRPGMLGPGGQT